MNFTSYGLGNVCLGRNRSPRRSATGDAVRSTTSDSSGLVTRFSYYRVFKVLSETTRALRQVPGSARKIAFSGSLIFM
jgi:hypothetical protein